MSNPAVSEASSFASNYAVSQALPWLFCSFIPFGDLLSDFWLLSSIPREKPDDYDCPEGLYTFMRVLLWFGTAIDTIPELALLSAVLPGLLLFVVLKAVVPRTPHLSEDDLSLGDLGHTLWGYLRKTISDGRDIVQFAFMSWSRETEPLNRANMMTYVAYLTVAVLHVPFLWVTRPVSDGHPYYHIVVIQTVGGVLTVVSSIFFAVMTRDLSAIVSAVLGVYALVVGTLVATLNGPQDGVFPVPSGVVDDPDKRRAPGDPYLSCDIFRRVLDYVPPSPPIFYVVAVYWIGATVMTICGLWNLVGGSKDSTGVTLTVFGFVLLGIFVLSNGLVEGGLAAPIGLVCVEGVVILVALGSLFIHSARGLHCGANPDTEGCDEYTKGVLLVGLTISAVIIVAVCTGLCAFLSWLGSCCSRVGA